MEFYGIFIMLTGVILFSTNIQHAIIVSPMMVMGPAKDTQHSESYFRSSFIIQLYFTVVFVLLILVAGELLQLTFLREHLKNLVIPLAFATAAILMQEYFRRYFFASGRTMHALVNDSLSYGLQLGVLVFTHFAFGLTLEICLYIIAITSCIAIIHGILASHLYSALSAPLLTQHLKVVKDHWIFGKWLIAQNITYWLGTQMVIYLTGFLLSALAVGAMGATRNIVGIVNILFLALDNFATPRASRSFAKHGMEKLNIYINRLTLLGGTLTACIALIASIAPEFWLKLVYSDEYSGYGWVVIAWSVFYMTGYFQRPSGIGLRVLDSPKSIFAGTLTGTIVALVITYPAISFGGLPGAMASLIIVQAVTSAYYMFAYRKQVEKHPKLSF